MYQGFWSFQGKEPTPKSKYDIHGQENIKCSDSALKATRPRSVERRFKAKPHEPLSLQLRNTAAAKTRTTNACHTPNKGARGSDIAIIIMIVTVIDSSYHHHNHIVVATAVVVLTVMAVVVILVISNTSNEASATTNHSKPSGCSCAF